MISLIVTKKHVGYLVKKNIEVIARKYNFDFK